jgi:BASS family bile acid:Na+ symporter
MLSMGLSLTVKQIIDPLKNGRLVLFAVIANFILVPLFVYGVIKLLPVTEGEGIGLILLSLAAGAPFLPKLAGIAKSNIAFSIGLMLLLMVITIFYLPLVLPWLLKGAQISSWDIAKSLIILMLIPLIAALLVRAYFEKTAGKLVPLFTAFTNIALVVLTVVLIVLHYQSLLDMIGYGMLSILILLIGAMIIGYIMGGPRKDTRIVLSLGTGQRNISAAILVATQNFTDPEVTLMLVAAAIIGLVIMLPYTARMGWERSNKRI